MEYFLALTGLSLFAFIAALIIIFIGIVCIPFSLSGENGTENELGAIVWFVILAFMVLVYPFEAISLLSPLMWLVAIPVYFAIGTLWFVWKWRSFILKKKADCLIEWNKLDPDVQSKYVNLFRCSNSDMRPAEFIYDNLATSAFIEFSKNSRPSAYDNRERIAGWIVLWPWSMLWLVVQFPWRLALNIAKWMRGAADRMVDRLWSEI